MNIFDSGLEYSYVAEGAANVVWAFEPVPTSIKSLLPGSNTPLLLRLRKNVSHLAPVAQQHEAFKNAIEPLLPSHVALPSAIVRLEDGLIDRLNSKLQQAERERSRPSKRHGTYLDQTDPHGLLMPDMRARGTGEVTLELKPKWLLQSPTAPANAKRCRTCALRAMRTATLQKPLHQTAFCPLDLASGNAMILSKVISRLLSSRSATHPDAGKGLSDHLLSSGLLSNLRNLQAQLDPTGVLNIEDDAQVPQDFLVATVLRDCTLFLRLYGSGVADAKLADFDFKDPGQGKLAYWKDVERSLIDGGWYAGADGGDTGCKLERDIP